MPRKRAQPSGAIVLAPSSSPAGVNLDPAKYQAALGALWGRLESLHSQRAYRDDWQRYCDWLTASGLDPRTADVEVVQRYVNHLRDNRKAPATRARALSILREVYRVLVVGKICPMNPAREVKNNSLDVTPRTPWLTEDGVRALFRATTENTWQMRRDRLVLLCLMMLGIRRAEVGRMTVEDVATGILRHIVKRKKQRHVGIPLYLQTRIREWLAYAHISTGTLFPRSPTDPQRMSDKMIYDTVRNVAAAAGVLTKDATPHSLRRSYITILEQRGVPLAELQLAVSHESINVTERYLKGPRAARQAPGELLVDLVEPGTPSKENDDA